VEAQYVLDAPLVVARYRHLDCPECLNTTDEPRTVEVIDETEPEEVHTAVLHKDCWVCNTTRSEAYRQALKDEGLKAAVIKPPHLWGERP
jgi:hypothetical protein